MSWESAFWVAIAILALAIILCLCFQNCRVCNFLAPRMRKIRAWEERWRGVLTALAVLAGGLWGWNQFNESQRGKRVDRTMEYILRYEQGPVADARHSFSGALKELGNHQLLPDEFLAAVDANIKTGDIEEAKIDTVVDFYEGLFVCTSNNICDKDATTSYFADAESENFVSNFISYICTRRRGNRRNSSYAKGLFWIANLGENSGANCRGDGK